MQNDLYLVTGGAGFIGSNIVRELINRENRVRVLDNLSTGRYENIAKYAGNPNFEFINGDLSDKASVEAAVQGAKYVLHQGALPSVPRSISDPIKSNEININGTLNILEASKASGVKRVVFASSSSVYGNNPKLPKDEAMPISPLSPYALTKYAGERYCQLYYQLYGLETVCLRYFNVFGPNQDPNSQYSAVIPKFVKAIINGEQPVIFGDGSQSRDFTFVKNNVEANLLACEADGVAGNVYNIACGDRYTLNDLVHYINLIFGKDVNAKYERERAGDVQHSMADITKAKTELGFKPKVGFREGLELTIKYYEKTLRNEEN